MKESNHLKELKEVFLQHLQLLHFLKHEGVEVIEGIGGITYSFNSLNSFLGRWVLSRRHVADHVCCGAWASCCGGSAPGWCCASPPRVTCLDRHVLWHARRSPALRRILQLCSMRAIDQGCHDNGVGGVVVVSGAGTMLLGHPSIRVQDLRRPACRLSCCGVLLEYRMVAMHVAHCEPASCFRCVSCVVALARMRGHAHIVAKTRAPRMLETAASRVLFRRRPRARQDRLRCAARARVRGPHNHHRDARPQRRCSGSRPQRAPHRQRSPRIGRALGNWALKARSLAMLRCSAGPFVRLRSRGPPEQTPPTHPGVG